MRTEDRMNGWTVELDQNVDLGQELNLGGNAERLMNRAESGLVTVGKRASTEGLAPEKALALAIVQQAAEDWRWAAEVLRFRGDDREATRTMRDTERFFRSRWFRVLVELDGTELLRRLWREAGYGEKGREKPGAEMKRLRRLQRRREQYRRMNRAQSAQAG